MASRYATQSELEVRWPNFVATDGTLVDAVMEDAECYVGLAFYEAKLSQAHILMSAHLLWMHPNAGATGTGGGAGTVNTGPVASMEDANSKVAWHANNASGSGGDDSDAWLKQTPPGRQLAALNATLHETAFCLLARAPVNPGRLRR